MLTKIEFSEEDYIKLKLGGARNFGTADLNIITATHSFFSCLLKAIEEGNEVGSKRIAELRKKIDEVKDKL